ncbi:MULTISPECIES: proton-conducting transporter membrane subunit [unclassified Carboxylicivirga]|uniref:proton-conducting transporter transmembrane domain-containing protein n=1 Tax=Carboxylicivirga TaxID=1628153 RepID=UPI003D33CD08
MTAIVLPILVPFLFILAFIAIKSHRIAQALSIIGSSILLVLSLYLFFQVKDQGILTLNMGGWKAPMGITLVIDYFSALMLVVTAVIGLAITIYTLYYLPGQHQHTRFYVFFFALMMGVNGAFTTGDVFNLYVWFEVILISSFILIIIGHSKAQLEGGIKYMALNLIGSLLFLAGLGLLYGKTGTLNMAHLAEILRTDPQSTLINSSTALFFIAFGIKAAVFPLFFWLPASYHTPNITVTALFAGLLTKVGVYALIRFFTLFFVQDQSFWLSTMAVIAGLTMVIGGMAASAHYDIRRILSYHIISQIGYMIMGLAIFTPLAIAGAIFFMLHNMIAKTNTFLVAGVIHRSQGSFHLKEVGGLLKQNPLLAILFIIPAFALVGVPPLSGFFPKFMLIKAGIEAQDYLIVAAAVITAMFTLYSKIKIWNQAFLKKDPSSSQLNIRKSLWVPHLIPLIILALVSVFLGLFAATIFDYTMAAAQQLIDPSDYIHHVLNNQ